MKQIPILGVGLQSKSSNVTAQSRINCYMDNSDDKNLIVAIGTPGLSLNKEFGSGSIIRALHVNGDKLYLVVDGNAYSAVEIAGVITTTLLGSVHYSTGYAEIDSNGLQIIITDNGKFVFTYTIASNTYAAMTDVDFPFAAVPQYQSVCFLDSFILANKPGTPRIQWSTSFDATAWDAADIATSESHPDNAIRTVAQGGYAYVFGTESIEFFSSDITGFSVIKGLTLSHGLSAVLSVSKVSEGVICLTSNRNGTSQISIVSPGNITKVSTSDIDSIINDYANISDATAFSYVLNGHEFYQINFTSGDQSWLYDLNMKLWSQLKSAKGRHFAEHGAKLNNHFYVSDYRNNGRLYLLDESINNDNGELIEFELTSKHIFDNLEKVSIKSLQIDAETGLLPDTGLYQNSQMIVGVSKDNGKTFSESFVSMGFPGEHKTRCRKNRLGMAPDWGFRIRITDRIKRVVLGAYIDLN